MALGITKVNGTLMSAATVGASATDWGTPLNAGIGERYGHLVFQVSVTFDASATNGAVVHMRKSADDGSTVTNDGTAKRSIEVSAGNTVVVELEAMGADYIEIGVENEDTVKSLIATIKYEGEKITGLD